MITQVKIEIETYVGEAISGALWVGRLGNKGIQLSGMTVTQCFDTNRENIWTLLISISERVLLSPPCVGVLTLLPFLRGALFTFHRDFVERP